MVREARVDVHSCGAMRKAVVPLLGLLVTLLGTAPGGAQTFSEPKFGVETVATLPPFTPVGIAWAPDGRMFLWTMQGVVRVVKNGQLLATPFVDISNRVNSAGDRGLLGLAFHPNFAENGWVYLLYSYEHAGNPNSTAARTSRLTRVTADPNNPDVALPNSEVVLLGTLGVPPCSNYGAGADCIPADWDSHVIGTLRFASDGTLFVSNGDSASYNAPDALALRVLDLNSYAGKILRVNDDGTAPRGNPFDDGTNSIRSKVWSYGLRNPYRFTLHPVTDEPYIADVGWNSFEEFNSGRGANFGWPCYEGAGPQPQYQSAFAECRNLPASAVTPPLYTYGRSEGATAIAGPFYTGNRYPAVYAGSWFVADYTSGWIRRMVFDAAGNPAGVVNFGAGFAGLVSLEQGPDGLLYYVDFPTGRIRRIIYSAPVARASAAPTSGYSPLVVEFSSAGTQNPDAVPLTYLWEFGDGTTSNEPNPTHTYISATVASFFARLTVTAQSGESSSETVRIVVGSLPPTATILEPANGSPAVPGDFIVYRGMGTDPDDGVLPDAALNWVVLLHHNDHVHARQTTVGPNGAVLIENHTHGTFAYEFILTVVDSSGLVHRSSVLLPVQGEPGAHDPQLLAAYAFDEGSGTRAGDSSANGYDADIFNGTWLASGRYGAALNFNSTSTRVTGPDAALGDRFTLMAWIYKTSHPNRWEQIAGVRGDRDMFVYNGMLAFWDGVDTLTFGGTLPLNTWMHVAVTYDGTALRAWLDGQPRGNPINRSFAPALGRIQIGSWWSGSNNYDFFGGRIDEVRISSRTLSQSEIQAMMGTPILTGDTTPPAVVVFSPVDGELLAGSARLEALAADNAGIAAVRFQLNGADLGPELTATPYVYFWDTTGFENGEYVITAVARDTAGLTRTSDPVSIFVGNGLVNRAPTVTASATAIVTTAGEAALNATATDDGLPEPPVLTTEWSVVSGPGAVFIADAATLSTTAKFAVAGTYTLRFTASDGELSRSARVGIVVTDPPAPTVESPNGGELAFTGLPLEIRWTATAAAAITGFDVLATAGNGFAPVPGCTGLGAVARNCVWASPGPATDAAQILVRVYDLDGNSAEDTSDGVFTLAEGAPTITVVAPNTAENWAIGSLRTVSWSHTLGAGQSVRVELSRNSGADWEVLAASVPAGAAGSDFVWTVAGPTTTAGLVRVVWTAVPAIGDASDAAFTIANPFLAVVGPTSSGENWGYDTLRRVTWNTNLGPADTVTLRLSTNGGSSYPIVLGSFPAANLEALFRTPILTAGTTKARVRAEWTTNPAVGSNSGVNFRVQPAFVTVTNPDKKNHAWTVGRTANITWNDNLGALEDVSIFLSRDNGSSFPTVLFASTPSDGGEAIVPLAEWATPNNVCRVRILWLRNAAVRDDSNQSFSIR
jgi:glucose/arabinose dehydrogenase